MEKVKITNIRVDWNNRDGQPYLDKRQKPYARIAIQAESMGKTWLSGFAYQNDRQLNWKVGDEVEVEIEQKGQYTNFKVPKVNQGGMSPEIVEKLFNVLRRIEEKIDNLELVDTSGEPMPTHSDEPDSENNPPF